MSSLVSYEYTDSEEDIENDEDLEKSQVRKNTNENELKNGYSTTDDNETQSMFSSLPCPKSYLSIVEENDEYLNREKNIPAEKKKPPTKISIPSIINDDSDEELDHGIKIKNASNKKSGLFAMLPPAKVKIDSNVKLVPTKIKQNALLPRSLTKRKIPIEKEDSDDEDITGNYLTSDFTDIKFSSPQQSNLASITVDSAQFVYDASKDNKYFSNIWTDSQSTNAPTEVEEAEDTKDETLTKLCGKAKKKKMKEEIKFIDINEDDIKLDGREWMMKSLTEEKPLTVSKEDEPSSLSRRKHQITYLAYQAKMNEQELKNRWALNRTSRKQTQAKYGF